MSSLIKIVLNGITNMTSTESGEKEIKMLNFTTKIPELDKENTFLFKAAEILESLGNHPGLTSNELNVALIQREIPTEQFGSIALAAVSIETMMSIELTSEMGVEPTVH
jgi:hypothetical protein